MSEEQNQPNTTNENKDEITEYYEGVKQLEISGYETGIRKARNALFITAGLVFLSEMISAFAADLVLSPVFWGIILIECGIFVALGFWTKSKPYAAVIIGLVIFLLLWVLAIVLNGYRAIYSGIIFKIFVIVALVRAIGPAKAWEEMKKQ
jgi:type III secretory pathway component EscR